MQTSLTSGSFFSADKKLTFLLLLIGTYAVLYMKVFFVEQETAAFEFLADRPEGFVLKALAALRFISVPLVYLWKFTVIGFVLWVGCFMWGYRVTYAQCWSIAIVSELVFLLPELLKVLWFLFIEKDPSWEAVNGFYPLSLISLFNYEDIDTRYAYPLRALNVFEVAYWFLLVEGVQFFSKRQKNMAFAVVFSSYVLFFFLWLWFYIIVYK